MPRSGNIANFELLLLPIIFANNNSITKIVLAFLSDFLSHFKNFAEEILVLITRYRHFLTANDELRYRTV